MEINVNSTPAFSIGGRDPPTQSHLGLGGRVKPAHGGGGEIKKRKAFHLMTIESDIAKIKAQEAALQFTQFNEADAWALGSAMRAAAEKQKLPLVIHIEVAGRQMFYAALPGTGPDNASWARRKVNTVMRFHAASYRVGLQHGAGRPFGAERGIDPMTHAPAGGGFPIAIKNVGVVGCIAVSGIPQRDDHGFVVEALCAHLNQPLASLALPPEST
jgi:uncharacterized protein (UPF0303 family)